MGQDGHLAWNLSFEFYTFEYSWIFSQSTLKSKGCPLSFTMIILSMGFIIHNAVLQIREKWLQYHSSRKTGKCSISPSCSVFPITCSSLEDESFPSLTDANVGRGALLLNKRVELNSPSLILLYVWLLPSFPSGGNHWH